jgi:hypothetical protein
VEVINSVKLNELKVKRSDKELKEVESVKNVKVK